jgi:glycosyltransferase involved in cell wall biosynthesis
VRVLHINGGNLYGGVESILVTLSRCRGLCPGMESSFAVCFEGRLSQELRENGVAVHSLGEVRSSRLWTVAAARRRLRELLRRRSFDAVICHMAWSHAIFGAEVRRARIPLVYWAHGSATGWHWLEWWARRSRPDLAIANSRFTAGSMSRLFDRVPVEVVYCPVPMRQNGHPERTAIRNALGVAEDAVVILQVSRIEPGKGHELHLRALAELREEPSWICLMAGGAQRPAETRLLESLHQQAEDLGLSGRVRFLGQRSDVSALMAAADIFCQPNHSPDTFGIVFIEAMAARLPVVTTAMGGATEIVTDACGRLIPPGDVRALAACLRTWIQTPALRRALGDAGPARAATLCDPASRLHQLEHALAALAAVTGLPSSGSQIRYGN